MKTKLLLNEVILCKGTESVAFVGAGGKTSAIFQLARHCKKPVLVTTTTRLGEDQASLADKHIIVDRQQQVSGLLGYLKDVMLVTAPPVHAKYPGLSEAQLLELKTLAGNREIPLLIEADGSRGLPIKAPAAHEPVIPLWVDVVVVVAGLSALGKSISAEIVHRLEEFLHISQASGGTTLLPAHLVKVLCDPSGGLKGVPGTSKRVCLLNQVENINLACAAAQIADELTRNYHHVLISSLKEQVNLACYQKTAGIILAAGGSARFGYPKQLIPWRGMPLIRHSTLRALESGLDPVIVVVGAVDQPIREVLRDLPVKIFKNENWALGQSTSIQSGIAALPGLCEAVVFLLADQPQVTSMLIRSLVEEHRKSLAPVVAPLIGGQRGNPVLFDRLTFDDLRQLSGDVGGRAIFNRYPVRWLEWVDEKVLVDLDSSTDLRKLEA